MLKSFLTALMILFTFSLALAQKTGKASFYHDRYDGRKTANGSIFRQAELTCASNVYKLNSIIRVTNKENGKSVIVKVTDNGAFKMPKIVDLSKHAFSQIASLKHGVIKVLIEEVN